MNRSGILAAVIVTLAVAAAVTGEATQEPATDLGRLAASLDLTGACARRWLERLGAVAGAPATERLQAVSLTGEPLLERHGGGSSGLWIRT